MKQNHILYGIGAKNMAVEFIGTQGFIQSDIKQGLTVVCPFHPAEFISAALNIVDYLGRQISVLQILDMKPVNFLPAKIHRINEFRLIGADRKCTNTAK